MDSYIVRIYRRDNHNHPLAGTVEPVEKNHAQEQRNPFNDQEKLWALLSLPDKRRNLSAGKNGNSGGSDLNQETENLLTK